MNNYSVRLEDDQIDYLNDVQEIPRAFSPYLTIDKESDNYFRWHTYTKDGCFFVEVDCNLFGKIQENCIISSSDILYYKRQTKHFLKNVLYGYLSSNLNINLPYGSLTGVRPTKVYYDLLNENKPPKEYLEKCYSVSQSRAELIENVVNNQKGIINNDLNNIGLFVNIPFCPTRCSYCSFISTEVFRVKKELPMYVDNVVKELELFNNVLKNTGKKIKSIYIGGGTPTSIGVELLNRITEPLKKYNVEFTVEAGRPDTINLEMLEMLKNNGVTRVSVNPQTFNEKTLKVIGRNHSIDAIYEAFNQAKSMDFAINMDLIALLQGETLLDFQNSVDKCLELAPDNITIHTLSLKKGSVLTINGDTKKEFGLAKKMLDYAYKEIDKKGYLPYYMYRQKNMADDLENVGFCKINKQCSYNIDMMEESMSIFGVGAGAISKIICGNGRIERLANAKGFREYNDRISASIINKTSLFS
ncbi:MAG: coproporphyrinogen dehydrogenase HemZ [Clostridia bacterium]